MKRKTLGAITLFLLIISAVLTLSYVEIKNRIDRPLDAGNAALVSFEIKSGQGVDEIGDNLEEAKLITGKDFFKLYLLQSGRGSKLRAGSYQLSPAMTITQMVDTFTGGGSGLKSNEARVSLAEGLSNEETLNELKKSGAVDSGADFENIEIDEDAYDFLSDKPARADLQGYLFPDTYNFFKDSELQVVTEKILDNFDSKLTPEMRSDIKDQGKSIYDTLILASIIEKEAGNKEEMPTIASVFVNRLAIGQALQSDATVNYITHAGRAMPTSEDLSVDSPYNTYKYPGLPPTPICNPGIEAIKAAIYPEKTDYFYFLTTQDGEQTTYFSKTYEEHLQNKALHLSR